MGVLVDEVVEGATVTERKLNSLIDWPIESAQIFSRAGTIGEMSVPRRQKAELYKVERHLGVVLVDRVHHRWRGAEGRGTCGEGLQERRAF